MLRCMESGKWSLENGIYRNGSNIDTSFSDIQQDNLYLIEDSSWWFEYRAAVILKMLNLFLVKEKLLFDLGGGNGYTALRVQEQGYRVALIEPSLRACANALKRGVKNIYCGTIDENSIRDGSVDQMMLLDVLEHISDHKKFMKLLRTKLILGGRCLVTVPAFPSLWSSEDEEAGHFRRYKRKELEMLAEECGFSVLYCNYFMEFLYLPILLVRVWMERLGLLKKSMERTREEQQRITKAQFEKRTGPVEWVLHFFQNRELKKIDKDKKIRFGSSLLIVLEKQE